MTCQEFRRRYDMPLLDDTRAEMLSWRIHGLTCSECRRWLKDNPQAGSLAKEHVTALRSLLRTDLADPEAT